MNTNILKKSLLFLTATVSLTVSAQNVTSDSLVNVAFRKVNAQDITGGVSTVNMTELTKKNYNTYSLDNMQGYVGGFNGNSLWGISNYLTLIDGVPRDLNNIKADEIDQITFLKGAQAVVLYGSRAANGVILITTKRGHISDRLNINVRANTGWNVAKSFPEYLGSAEYMTLYNEACINDGRDPLYSSQDIYNYGSGINPYRYPNIDMYSADYVKKTYNRSDVTAEIEGGNERARFYSNVSYFRQGDFFDFGQAANNYTDRFDVRGNVDMKLNDFITAYVNADATFYNAKSPVGGDYWQNAATLRPNRISPLIPLSYLDPNTPGVSSIVGNSSNIIDGMYFLGGTQSDMSNIIADYYAAGKSSYTSRQFQFDAGIDFDLDKLLHGLSFHALVAIDYATSYNTSFNNTYATYRPHWSDYNGSQVIVGVDKYNLDKRSGVQNVSGSNSNQTIAFNAHFDYNRTFASNHNLSAMLIANGFQQSKSGQYHKTSNANLALQMAYNFAHRYYADFSLAAPWSSKLPSGNRLAISPSLTLGWNLARESFLEGSVFNDLLLNVSASSIATDLYIDDYYMYQGYYTHGAWWNWNASGVQTFYSKRGNNPDMNYIRRKEFSVGLRGAMFSNTLSFNASYFVSQISGQLMQASSILPSYFMSYYPESSFITNINYNNDNRSGFDFSLNYKKQLGEVLFDGGVNMTYYTTKASRRDDTNYKDQYQYREGKHLDAIWGYQCLGFFKNQEDIDNSPEQQIGGTVRPGDLKYKDQNGDGVIDSKDMVDLGKGGWYGAPFTLGINLSAKYKNFTLFMLCVGGFGGHAIRNNENYWWISGEDKYSVAVRDRAIVADGEVTNLDARYPRLTTESGANNFQTSDFWLYSTSRFDLAKLQLTYDFPRSILGNGIVKQLSVYASGSNLLTFAKERKLLELNVGSAPQTRFYNIGAKVTF